MLTIHVLNEYLRELSFDLAAFAPELILCGTIVLMLLIRVLPFMAWMRHQRVVAGVGVFLSLLWACDQCENVVAGREIFQGMLAYDMFTVYFRVFLLFGSLLVIGLTVYGGVPDAEDSADFHVMLLGSVVGMMMMAAANHLLMVFLAVEMASVPSYALAGFLKGRKQSSEAALKYVVYGGAAAGVMLYGLSLLAGMTGTLHVPTLARTLLAEATASSGKLDISLLLALSLILVGLAFKLSAVPFHFWCPDVFEGASAEVAGFLSVLSKGAAVALAARFTMALVGYFPGASTEVDWSPLATLTKTHLAGGLAIMAGATATFGNLAAFAQTNVKRLLAYSTIAHAGFMLMALATLSRAGVDAALFYVFSYLFMNLGAFAVVAFVRNQTGSEEIEAFRGLFFSAPWLAFGMTICLMSLLGLPPLVGFFSKLLVFRVLYEEGMISLLVVGAANTVFALVYYINLMRIMAMPPANAEAPAVVDRLLPSAYVQLLAAPVLVLGIFPQMLARFSEVGADGLAPHPPMLIADPVGNEPTFLVANAGESTR